MRAASARAWRHLGWRGLALAGIGSCWIVYGLGLILTTRGSITSGTAPLIRIMCIQAWGGVWIAAGVLGIIAGTLRPGRDMWGFAAVCLPPAYWALSFTATAATGAYEVAWAAVPIYAAIVLLIAIVAVLSRGRTHG
ncbi:hypothetical protein QFZ75_003700 [Streptomyces sp. V3I8]|uniref:hypothetical protein n=1 Tax=Streptomyces sp. V3I8 TaxID=3042279 RepID=UPI0027848E20|nr:hypothetical protein [Streptomyces sp. V3I8]MDQ1037284.1 hypothetical protein [Streptomyces sp. V3I8]